uniref:Uncharacterized protein n=1 Tax=Arundo donax TaxID=35708 RepID=A0A0A9AI60_ARUDO
MPQKSYCWLLSRTGRS